MNDDNLMKDSLDRVSGQLRKAVGLNRHEMGGLRNIVSQMKRDRNKSMGLLSKKQQEFLQKQARLLPAINAKRKTRKISNQVIPLSRQEGIGQVNEKIIFPKIGNSSMNTTQFNILPPIRMNVNSTKDSTTTENEAKLRRISDYQKEISSLQESLNNAHRFASNDIAVPREGEQKEHVLKSRAGDLSSRRYLHSLSETRESGDNSKQLRKELTRDSVKSNRKNQRLANDIDLIESETRTKASLKNIDRVMTISIDEVAIANEPFMDKDDDGVAHSEDEEVEKKDYWQIVREKLGFIATMNKQRHSQYLEQLYNEIRKCRYIRKPRKMNQSTGLWYESGEESGNEET